MRGAAGTMSGRGMHFAPPGVQCSSRRARCSSPEVQFSSGTSALYAARRVLVLCQRRTVRRRRALVLRQRRTVRGPACTAPPGEAHRALPACIAPLPACNCTPACVDLHVSLRAPHISERALSIRPARVGDQRAACGSLSERTSNRWYAFAPIFQNCQLTSVVRSTILHGLDELPRWLIEIGKRRS